MTAAVPDPRFRDQLAEALCQGAVSVRIDCWCITCDAVIAEAQADNGDWLASRQSRFIVCPDCGNKRCPRATHHDNACTGSNEPGQPGSAYAQSATPATSVQEIRDRILADPTRRALDAS